MDQTGRASRGMPGLEPIAAVSTFLVGLGDNLVVCLLWAADSRPASLIFAGSSVGGALCAVIGAVSRSRSEGLLAGGFGLSLMVLILGSGYGTPWLVMLGGDARGPLSRGVPP